MNLLITGASGFIGRSLCQLLHQGGHSLTLVSRKPKSLAAVFSFPFNTLEWDLASDTLPKERLTFDGVIHLAGESIAQGRWTESRKAAILDSRVQGIERLKDYLVSPPSVFVSSSAIGIYGDRGDEVLTEASSLGSDFLANVCRAWEDTATRCFSESKTRVASLRTGIVLGKEGGILEKLCPIFKMGLGGRIGSGQQWMSWIHVEDLCKLFALALNDHRWSGAINAVAPQPVTNQVFTHTLAQHLHRPALLPVPAFALKLAMGEMATIALASQRVTPAKALKWDTTFRFSTLDDALTNLVG